MDNGNVYESKRQPKLFKIYVAIMLALIVILLAVIVGIFGYAGMKVKSDVNTVNGKIDTFNSQASNINSNLQELNTQIEHNTSALSSDSSK